MIDSSCLLHETAAIVGNHRHDGNGSAILSRSAHWRQAAQGTTAAGVANAFVSAGIASNIAKLLQKVVPRLTTGCCTATLDRCAVAIHH
ncbi:MAG: hypothetical protein R3E54_03735 [Halioglobus sp.]